MFLVSFMKLSMSNHIAVISLECCSSPPESSSMSACKKAGMNSGKVQMTARPPTRSGKRNIKGILHFCLSLLLMFFGGLSFELFGLLRRSVIETSRSLKELFHEARERASKALGFAKMLRKVSDITDVITY